MIHLLFSHVLAVVKVVTHHLRAVVVHLLVRLPLHFVHVQLKEALFPVTDPYQVSLIIMLDFHSLAHDSVVKNVFILLNVKAINADYIFSADSVVLRLDQE